jgi:hypothetical protein
MSTSRAIDTALVALFAQQRGRHPDHPEAG